MTTNTGATSIQAIPYPQLADQAHPDNIKELANYIDGRIVMRFASAAARDAAIASPAAGMSAWLTDVKQITVYDGTSWKVGVDPAVFALSTTPPYCQVTASSTANVGSGSFTNIAFDGEVEKTANMTHSNVTNNTRVTVTIAGLYTVTVSTSWTANATGMRGILVKKNGTNMFQDYQGAPTTQGSSVSASWDIRLAANDYIEAARYQSSGGNLAPVVVNTQPAMMIVRRVSA